MRTPWLSRPQTIRRLWWTFAVVLFCTLLAEWLIDRQPHFSIEDWIGFNAIFGFFACVLMILVARAIGLVLKRRDDYYDGD